MKDSGLSEHLNPNHAVTSGKSYGSMARRYAFILFGYPGSGKSYVAEWLAPHFHAVHLRSDDLRVTMFGGDRPDLHSGENKSLVNNAFEYAYGQILQAKSSSIVMDANYNQRRLRQRIAVKARRYGAEPIVVWVKTPENVAEARIKSRAESGGHVIFDPHIIENMKKRMDVPDESERVIELDGLLTAEEQQASFDKQLALLF